MRLGCWPASSPPSTADRIDHRADRPVDMIVGNIITDLTEWLDEFS
jgi:hypothetical protein